MNFVKDPILYKFVRSCLNRAYLEIDESQLSADERFSLDTILSVIRYAEDEWKDVDDFIKFLQDNYVRLYKDAIKRLPKELVYRLFTKTLEKCLELEEVKNNSSIYSTIISVLKTIKEL